ncbi:uncharacterized protein LOC105373397 [Homo sapiens]|uniref:uncharacterized protein LOC105373397 n=1 Tax=Homo sapiens TaxID=9606 RepID=UPI0005D0364A|nr:uncharacterized protein LOC105373397 [Homo sapiens]
MEHSGGKGDWPWGVQAAAGPWGAAPVTMREKWSVCAKPATLRRPVLEIVVIILSKDSAAADSHAHQPAYSATVRVTDGPLRRKGLFINLPGNLWKMLFGLETMLSPHVVHGLHLSTQRVTGHPYWLGGSQDTPTDPDSEDIPTSRPPKFCFLISGHGVRMTDPKMIDAGPAFEEGAGPKDVLWALGTREEECCPFQVACSPCSFLCGNTIEKAGKPLLHQGSVWVQSEATLFQLSRLHRGPSSGSQGCIGDPLPALKAASGTLFRLSRLHRGPSSGSQGSIGDPLPALKAPSGTLFRLSRLHRGPSSRSQGSIGDPLPALKAPSGTLFRLSRLHRGSSSRSQGCIGDPLPALKAPSGTLFLLSRLHRGPSSGSQGSIGDPLPALKAASGTLFQLSRLHRGPSSGSQGSIGDPLPALKAASGRAEHTSQASACSRHDPCLPLSPVKCHHYLFENHQDHFSCPLSCVISHLRKLL